VRWLGFTLTILGIVTGFTGWCGVAAVASQVPAARGWVLAFVAGVALHSTGTWLMKLANRSPKAPEASC
jgi:hypothetical protein